MDTQLLQPTVSPDRSICFDKDLIQRYGGRGPRYTSYPTAVQFNELFTASEYERFARASNDSAKPISLYVHIPFCNSLCYYCACNKIITRNEGRVATYLQRLAQEIDLQSKLFDRSRKVEQLHFGGGTPTYLNQIQLRLLFAQLRRAFSLDHSDGREFSIEVDPRSVDADSMQLLAELGFNRISLGVQDFDRKVQLAVNRLQSKEEVSRLTESVRELDFRSVSFDLIYGLPHQTIESFDRTLDQTLEMRPDRLAIYNYAHLPSRFKGQRMINDADIPSPECKLEILHHTIDKLVGSGYVYIGMDHFALPDDDLVKAQENGTLQRNFQGYSTHGDADLVGLGVSAIGSIGNAYSQNSTSTKEYEATLSNGVLPVARGVVVDQDDQFRAAVIQQLMCYEELNFAEFDSRFDTDFVAYFAPELQQVRSLAKDGLLDLDKSRIKVSPKGRLLLRSIAAVFDRYLNVGNDNSDIDSRQYSKAI
jgi:oxygen-independent coproporphyrinogen-3 oxidase